jgi:peptide/nickel transport system substrate-binding protein
VSNARGSGSRAHAGWPKPPARRTHLVWGADRARVRHWALRTAALVSLVSLVSLASTASCGATPPATPPPSASSAATTASLAPVTGTAAAAADAAAAAAAGAAGTGATTTSTAATGGPLSGLRLTIAEHLEAALGDNFNPFKPSSTLSQIGALAFIYEPLLQYDELQVDRYYPWLAESWNFSLSGETITFQLRPGIRWDDGSRFTAADVAYTFNLLRDYPDVNRYHIPVVSAVATGATTFTLTLSRPGWAYVYDIARVPIVKAGFAAGHDPSRYVVHIPDGTGPFRLAHARDFDPHQLVLSARAGYWQQGQPSVQELAFPAYPSVTAVRAAMLRGDLDWAGPFPGLQPAALAKRSSKLQYWLPPVNCVALVVNLSRYPLDLLKVRKAISASVGRDALSSGTQGGYEPPATSSSGLVLPIDRQYLSASDTHDLPGKPDLTKARNLMLSAGFHMSQAGYWANPSGKPVGFSIDQPAGSVYYPTANLLALQLKAAGFDVAVKAVPASTWGRKLSLGHYDSTIRPSSSGPSPYYMYQNLLDPSLLSNGTAAGGDYERLSKLTNPAAAAAVATALEQYTTNPSGSPAASSAIEKLASVVSTQLPVIPLLCGVSWGEFSTTRLEGWPDGEDPYEPPEPAAPFNEYTVLQLAPA